MPLVLWMVPFRGKQGTIPVKEIANHSIWSDVAMALVPDGSPPKNNKYPNMMEE
jgi:hypothetical protein